MWSSKFPKWPFDKFVYAKRTLGTQMKATGEVMAIDNSFEDALMKAVRGCEIKLDSTDRRRASGSSRTPRSRRAFPARTTSACSTSARALQPRHHDH
ncbi:MAG: hypothetical protein ACLR4Z_11965 [Butyricicoccaceae bacterium]